MVGTSGSSGERASVLTPSARRRPSFTSGTAVIGVSKNTMTSPLISACCAAGALR